MITLADKIRITFRFLYLHVTLSDSIADMIRNYDSKDDSVVYMSKDNQNYVSLI